MILYIVLRETITFTKKRKKYDSNFPEKERLISINFNSRLFDLIFFLIHFVVNPASCTNHFVSVSLFCRLKGIYCVLTRPRIRKGITHRRKKPITNRELFHLILLQAFSSSDKMPFNPILMYFSSVDKSWKLISLQHEKKVRKKKKSEQNNGEA